MKKSYVLATFSTWVSTVEKELSQSVNALKSDNAGEYVRNEMKAFIQSWGIVRRLIVPGNLLILCTRRETSGYKKLVARERPFQSIKININSFSTERSLRSITFRPKELSHLSSFMNSTSQTDVQRYTCKPVIASYIVFKTLVYNTSGGS